MADDRDILVIDDCECGCGCNEVELHSDHQPEVLLFDEYGELYENDIIETRSLVERIWDFIQDKYTTIVNKINTLLGDTDEIKDDIVASTAAIRQDIAEIILSQTLEECSEQDIYDMFEYES